MGIRWKLGFILLIIGLVPLILFSVVSTNTTQQILKNEIGQGFELVAREKAVEVASVLNRRIAEAKSLAQHPTIIAAVVAGNRSYEGKDDAASLENIKRIDRAWIAAKGDIRKAKAVHDHPAADFLRAYQGHAREEYGEIFLTDRLGGTIAMTGLLTDYDQSDEGWWRDGFAGGQGSVFIDDRGMDLSVNAVVTGIVVPVRVDGKVAGILKINFKMAHIPAIITNPFESNDVHIFMLRTGGLAVIDPSQGKHSVASKTEAQIIMKRVASGWTEDLHDNTASAMGYARVQPERMIYSRFVPDHSKKGVSGEKWGQSDWYVFVERNLDTAYAPLNELALFALFGGAALTLIIIIVSGVISTTVTQPLLELRNRMGDIAEGNLDIDVTSDRKDEIGDVVRDIGSMVKRLKTTLASRDELNDEIARRVEVETALKEQSTKLETSMVEAELANQAKTRFLSSMSHELRTPLNSVIGFSQLMQLNLDEPLTEKQKKYTDNVIAGGIILLELINDVLDLAKIEAGKLDFVLENHEAGEIIRESIVLAQSSADMYAITISNHTVKHPPMPIHTDSLRLKQVLINLLSNAIKYNKSDGTVDIDSTETEDGFVRISVTDKGIGIAPNHFENVFKPFERLGVQAKKSIEGSGIGLSVARQLMEGMGGRIGFTSDENVGSTFWVEVPLASQ